MATETIKPRARFINGEPPRSRRQSKRRVRADWRAVVDKARSKPGKWLVIERHSDIQASTSAFRVYEDVEVVDRGGTLYLRATNGNGNGTGT